MATVTAALILFLAYAVNSQWAFRCQRVGRGILLLARDSATGHPQLFSAIMPTSYVASIWIGRLLWLGCAYFVWSSWSWYGIGALVVYSFVVGSFVDAVSPWPSYSKLLTRIKARIYSGKAGTEAMLLLPTIYKIEEEVARGTRFESATTGVWMGRSVEAGREAGQSPQPASSTSSVDSEQP